MLLPASECQQKMAAICRVAMGTLRSRLYEIYKTHRIYFVFGADDRYFVYRYHWYTRPMKIL